MRNAVTENLRVRIPVWDIKVDPMRPEDVVDWIARRDRNVARTLVGHNLHSAYLSCTNRDFRRFCAASDLRLVDGFPILVLVNLLLAFRGVSPIHGKYRTGSTDWLPLLNGLPAGFRVAVIGASRESNEKAVAALSSRCQDLDIRGWDGFSGLGELVSGEFSEINDFAPDLILIGLGMPNQEAFISKHRDYLPNSVYATVGGAIDQIAGVQRNAPRSVGRFGLEWLWRLVHEPRRMWRRYLVEPLLLGWVTALMAKRIAVGRFRSRGGHWK